MGVAIDIQGQQFGKLTVLERDGSIENRAAWKCKCECGNIIRVTGTDLRRGRKKDCGCVLEQKKHDIANQRFGSLIALYPIDKRSNDGSIIWHCKCDCGNEIDVRRNHLVSGNTSSCGCVGLQKFIERNHQRKQDLTGKVYGLLTVLYDTEKRTSSKSPIWKCKCECGNECEVSTADLQSNNTKSCGCMRTKSFGEQKIISLLKQANINFIREYKPLNHNMPFNARFDFYLSDYNCLIEYDGIQHFVMGVGAFDNAEKFKITQEHDKIKTQWCKDNDISLIRIPYTHLDNITLEDLLPETSKFLI